MSKIEQALRIAKKTRAETIVVDSVGEADASTIAANQDQDKKRRFDELRNRSTLPAVIRLEPSTRYELDDQVLFDNRIISNEYPQEALTAFKMLRTRILQKMKNNNWRTIAVTSPRDGAGKTVTAINLAIAMASHGAHEVYLLDLDLKNPEIGTRLGLPEFDLDLGEYLVGRAPLSRVCCDVGIEHLYVLPSSQRQQNSSELITSEPMQGLLQNIGTMVSDPIILIDVPALLTADDALAISPWVDGFVLVAAESDTAREDVVRSKEMLRESNVLGVVLNKSNDTD